MPAGFRVYLASRSPRRRQLLRQIGVQYTPLILRERPPRGPDIDESVLAAESPEDYVRRVCQAKAQAGVELASKRGLQPLPVLAADTIVCLGGEILGKPADKTDAARMLRALSGREHRVLSAVALQSQQRSELALNESRVRFRELSDSDIASYVQSGEPSDKAGAYAVQGSAAAFIEELRGSFSGVMGLPLYETAMLIGRFRS